MSMMSNGSHNNTSGVYQYPYITSSIPNPSAINPQNLLSTPQQQTGTTTATSTATAPTVPNAIVVPTMPSNTTTNPLTLLNPSNPLNMNLNALNSIKSPPPTAAAGLPSLSAVNSGSMGSHYTPTAIKSTSAISSPVGPPKLNTTSYSSISNTSNVSNVQNTGTIFLKYKTCTFIYSEYECFI